MIHKESFDNQNYKFVCKLYVPNLDIPLCMYNVVKFIFVGKLLRKQKILKLHVCMCI